MWGVGTNQSTNQSNRIKSYLDKGRAIEFIFRRTMPDNFESKHFSSSSPEMLIPATLNPSANRRGISIEADGRRWEEMAMAKYMKAIHNLTVSGSVKHQMMSNERYG